MPLPRPRRRLQAGASAKPSLAASIVARNKPSAAIRSTSRCAAAIRARIELHGRIAEGSAAGNPVIELVLRLGAAAAPELHPLAAQPLDADIVATLRGLADFSPKPWPARFREIQARAGSIEIAKARVQ